jgi:hypothetical protein
VHERIDSETITSVFATTELPIVSNLDSISVVVYTNSIAIPPKNLLAFEKVEDPVTEVEVATFDPFLPPVARFPIFGHIFTKLKKNPNDTTIVRTCAGIKFSYVMKQAIQMDADVAKRIKFQPIIYYPQYEDSGYASEYNQSAMIRWIKVFKRKGIEIVKPILVKNDTSFFEAEVEPSVIGDLEEIGVFADGEFLLDKINVISCHEFRNGLELKKLI